MTEKKNEYKFQADTESELYLSLIEPAWRSTVINKALNKHLSEQALIDIADGRGIVSFWRKLDFHKKAEVLRRFGSAGTPEEQADQDLWAIVIRGEPKDFFVMAAKYLTLHQLKHGVVWTAATEITGEKTRKKKAKSKG